MRYGHDEHAEILEVIGDVNGRDCMIVDDFTFTGSTLIETAAQLKSRGAKKVYACVSHSLINEQNLADLRGSDVDLLITTDSVDNRAVLKTDITRVVSVAPLFAETVRRIHVRESVSVLFDEAPLHVLEKLEKDIR